MKTNYIAPLCEKVVMDTLMVDYLAIATLSNGDPATVTGGEGA